MKQFLLLAASAVLISSCGPTEEQTKSYNDYNESVSKVEELLKVSDEKVATFCDCATKKTADSCLTEMDVASSAIGSVGEPIAIVSSAIEKCKEVGYKLPDSVSFDIVVHKLAQQQQAQVAKYTSCGGKAE